MLTVGQAMLSLRKRLEHAAPISWDLDLQELDPLHSK